MAQFLSNLQELLGLSLKFDFFFTSSNETITYASKTLANKKVVMNYKGDKLRGLTFRENEGHFQRSKVMIYLIVIIGKINYFIYRIHYLYYIFYLKFLLYITIIYLL